LAVEPKGRVPNFLYRTGPLKKPRNTTAMKFTRFLTKPHPPKRFPGPNASTKKNTNKNNRRFFQRAYNKYFTRKN
jgi:hypothetical protein